MQKKSEKPLGKFRAFSGKQKKAQLQQKRNRKNENNQDTSDVEDKCNATEVKSEGQKCIRINYIPDNKQHYMTLLAEPENVLKERKAQQHMPISKESTQVDSSMFFPEDIRFPTRPTRDPDMNKTDLFKVETENFQKFRNDMNTMYKDTLGRYELNYETWTTLWKVVNISDLILFVADVRFCAAQFPINFYHHLNNMGKKVLLVLNKCDLVPKEVTLTWMQYFESKCPGLLAVPYCSNESKKEKDGRFLIAEQSSLGLIDACDKLMEYKVDFQELRERVQRVQSNDFDVYFEKVENPKIELTIGTVGLPNVGKSSLINSIFGKNFVSVRNRPGHTKTAIAKPVSQHIKLCDCPGLIFPSICPPLLQVVMGVFPIAQERAPASVVGYLASRINIPKILGLSLTKCGYEEWTPYNICEAWAKRRNFQMPNGNPDVYRAGNEILRSSVFGKRNLVTYFTPTNFTFTPDEQRLTQINEIIRAAKAPSRRIPKGW